MSWSRRGWWILGLGLMMGCGGAGETEGGQEVGDEEDGLRPWQIKISYNMSTDELKVDEDSVTCGPGSDVEWVSEENAIWIVAFPDGTPVRHGSGANSRKRFVFMPDSAGPPGGKNNGGRIRSLPDGEFKYHVLYPVRTGTGEMVYKVLDPKLVIDNSMRLRGCSP